MLNRNFPDYKRSFACVDLGKIKKNFDALRDCISSDVKIMAVIKADAYGHGSVEVAKSLENRADYFAVADIEEAVEIRKAGVKTPILILAYTNPSLFSVLVENGFTATVYSLEDAKILSETAVKLGKIAKIHIAVDTGMSRIGFNDTAENADVVKDISELDNIEIEGIFSHLACADVKDKTDALNQKNRFDAFLAMLCDKGVDIPLKHISNSAAAIDMDCSYSMVRLGISLYGMYPSDEVESEKVELYPAMEVFSHVIRVNEIDAGVGVGYGHAYVAKEKRRIATVSIGYADGYSRAFSNKGVVLINGKRASVIGKVCMDQIMVDITDIENVKAGDTVVIMGKDGDEFISAEELGELSGSFNYEVICTFMPRVKRTYFDETE